MAPDSTSIGNDSLYDEHIGGHGARDESADVADLARA
jgi:hypothetical protein